MESKINQCLYLNPEKQNGIQMMKPCDQPFPWPCSGQEFIDTRIQSYWMERPSGDNKEGGNPYSKPGSSKPPATKDTVASVEGFTNMGEHYVQPGDCPDGYQRNPTTGKCEQVCMNCKYNERTYKQSKEFNEFDPCFPHNGVYDGIDNDGYVRCTCGNQGQYCGDTFDAQGGMLYGGTYIMNVGDFGFLGDLASY